MVCKNCGNQLAEGLKFCTKCGTPAEAAPAAPADGAAPPVAPAQGAAPVALQQEQAPPPPQQVPAAPVQEPAQAAAGWQAPPPQQAPVAPVQEPAQAATGWQAPPPQQAPVAPGQEPAQAATGWQAPLPQQAPAGYGQPQGYGTPSYGVQGQPAMAAAGAVPPPAKKKGGKKALIITLAVVLVLAAVGVTLFFLLGKKPRGDKAVIQAALDNTFTTMGEERRQGGEQLAFSAVMEQLRQEEATHGKIDLSLSAEGDTLALEAEMYTDLSMRRVDMMMSMLIPGVSKRLELELGFEDDLIAFALPNLFEGSYGIYTETLGEDYGKSPLAGLLGSLGPAAGDISFNLFDLAGADAEALQVLTPDTRDKLSKLYETLWDRATAVHNGTASTTVSGDTNVCEAYTVTSATADLAAYLRGLMEALMDDAQFGPAFVQGMIEQTPRVYDEADLRAYINNTIAGLEEALAASLDTKFYLKDDLVLKIEMVLESSNSSNQAITLALEFGGGKYVSNACTLRVSMGDDWFLFSAKGNHVPQNGLFYTEILAAGYNSRYDEETTFLDLSLRYDSNKSSDNVTFYIMVGDDESSFDFELTGTIEVDENASRVLIDFRDIEFSVAGGPDFTLSFSYLVEPLGSHTFNRLKPTLLFEMNQMQIQNLIMEIALNLQKLDSFF